MKSRFIPLILILIFLITFVIFFKGLKNSNIYTPNTNLEKKVPSFELKSFENNSVIISEKIFKNNKYYFMNIWAGVDMSYYLDGRWRRQSLVYFGEPQDLVI